MDMNQNNEGLTIQFIKENQSTQKKIELILLESKTIAKLLQISDDSTLSERAVEIIRLVQDCQIENEYTSFKKQVLNQIIYLIMEKASDVAIRGNKLVKIYSVPYESLAGFFNIPKDLLETSAVNLNGQKQHELDMVTIHLERLKKRHNFTEIYKEYQDLKKIHTNMNSLMRENKEEFKHIIELETKLSKIINLMKKSYVDSQPVSNKLVAKILGIPQHTVLSLTINLKNKYIGYLNKLLDVVEEKRESISNTTRLNILLLFREYEDLKQQNIPDTTQCLQQLVDTLVDCKNELGPKVTAASMSRILDIDGLTATKIRQYLNLYNKI